MQWWAGARLGGERIKRHKRRCVVQTLLLRFRLTHPTKCERWNSIDNLAPFVPRTIELVSERGGRTKNLQRVEPISLPRNHLSPNLAAVAACEVVGALRPGSGRGVIFTSTQPASTITPGLSAFSLRPVMVSGMRSGEQSRRNEGASLCFCTLI